MFIPEGPSHVSRPNPGTSLPRSDPLLMLADVTRLVAEHWGGDEALIRAIYEHQIATTGRQPTLQQARDYLDHLVARLDDATLRETLGLAPATRAPRVPDTPTPKSPARPKLGRPNGSGLDVAAVRATYQALCTEHHRRPTQEELATRLDVAARSLQRFLRAHGVAWPLAE